MALIPIKSKEELKKIFEDIKKSDDITRLCIVDTVNNITETRLLGNDDDLDNILNVYLNEYGDDLYDKETHTKYLAIDDKSNDGDIIIGNTNASSKKIIKIFVSQPMTGLRYEEINDDYEHIKNFASDLFTNCIVKFLTTKDAAACDKPEGTSDVWYLANALNLLCVADFIIFHPDWKQSRGCTVEHFVAEKYDIPIIDLSIIREDLNP